MFLLKRPILYIPWTCWKCHRKMKVTYPTTEDVYRTDFKGNLAPIYNKTEKENKFGNLCPNCRAYQGNFYVQSILFENPYDMIFINTHSVGSFNIKINCMLCGNELHKDQENALDIYGFWDGFNEYLESKKIAHYEKKIKQELIDVFSIPWCARASFRELNIKNKKNSYGYIQFQIFFI